MEFQTNDKGHRRFHKKELDRVMKRSISENETEKIIALNALSDLVLAEIWDNDRDAVYDYL